MPAMNPLPRTTRLLCCMAAGLALAACGGGEIGGSVSGLGSGLSVTLLNNDSDALTVSRNGSFTFADTVAANGAYAVTVRKQPVGQSCSVADGSGTLDADGTSIDSVRISCSFSASLRGTVSGLEPGVAVTLVNGSSQLAVAADGPFAFPDILSDGTLYELRVLVQPAGASCVVQNGSGSFIAASFQDISVLCS
jgi:hypothetical protein